MPIELKEVGKITGRFLVPAYQRGYRWGEEEVKFLLADIVENGDSQYCLQPIVVKEQEGQPGQLNNTFELIDGQQRLTTLYLIFLYMKREQLKNFDLPFSIEYETRPLGADYLATLNPAQQNKNIDFFHIYRAYQCIKDWFDLQENQQLAADDLYRYLHRFVKVIWYKADHNIDSTTLFTRLNVGRIPLTNAELVKALLLARRTMIPQPDDYRQIEIASQWDLIERDLHDERFWAFLSNQPGQEFPTRIEFIFNIMAGIRQTEDRFHTFFYFKNELDNQSVREVWRRILELYYLLKDWYEDRDLYHKVGYLIATGKSLADLVKESKECTKSAFHYFLNESIKKKLSLSENDVRDMSYEKPDRCTHLLLLFNVETVRLLKNSSERYPFHAHKEQSWSLEHIHAQHTETLSKKEQWQEWLKQHLAGLDALKFDDQADENTRKSLLKEIGESIDGINQESFSQLSNRIIEIFNTTDTADSMHSISNLALLSGEINSTLSNSVFQIKRLKVIALDRAGEYIPICTRRVFFKYYTNTSDQQAYLWSLQDRKCYVNAMIDLLKSYLNTNTEM